MNLYHRTYGKGQSTLVVLHGLFGSSDNWQTVARSLGESYQVITMDLRNHGLSPHADEFDFEVMADDLKETLDALALSQIILMGHSLGGKTAAYFALKYPAYVDALIIIDIAPKAYPAHHHVYFEAMQSMNLPTMTTRTEADEWLKRTISDHIIRQFLLKNLTRDDQGRFKWRFNLDALYKHYDHINVELSSDLPFLKPTLYVKGADSEYIQPEDKGLIKSLFPNAGIITIPGAGHWVHADQPGLLQEAVLGFLETSAKS